MIEFNKGKIENIVCCLPENEVDLHDIAKKIPISEIEAKKIIKTTGFKKIRKSSPSETSLDLCYKSAIELISDLKKTEVEKIDAILFVSQTRDYILPQSSNILQNKLNLRTDIICLDIPMGCSGYVYGLFQAFLLIKSGMRNILLLAGETSTKMISPRDKTVSMVFGDAGSASLISDEKCRSLFDFGNDGSGSDFIKINVGGSRNSYNNKANFKEDKIEDGIFRSDLDLKMDGLGIMNFALKRVPDSISNIKSVFKSKIDKYYFHQANRFMIRYLSKKMKLSDDLVPFNADNIGNTGPVSIPLSIAMDLNSNKNKLENFILCGFGVGLSWATCVIESKNIKSKII